MLVEPYFGISNTQIFVPVTSEIYILWYWYGQRSKYDELITDLN